MGKKKLFKRLLAVVMALVLSNVVTTVERAEAASCPPHGEYYDMLVYARTLYDEHTVYWTVTVTDDKGNVRDETIVPVECKIHWQQYYYEVRCKRCNTPIGSYDYCSEKVHDMCL